MKLEYLYDLVFPRRCVTCGLEGCWLCDECKKRIIKVKSPTCPVCNKLTLNGNFCSRHRSNVDLTGVIAAAHWDEGPLKEAVHVFKYEYVKELSKELSELLIERLELGFPTGDLILLPVPLHPKRLAARGFNQAQILSEIISESFDIELENNLLFRKINTIPQVELSGGERHKNVIDAFGINRTKKLKNKTVLLIDDLFTTGSTLNECAKLVRKQGARQVWGLVLAKG